MDNSEFVPWPCCELSPYPLDSHWTDTFPMSKLSRLRYIHILNATRSFFLTPELADTYAQLRNYAFQQGQFSNANAMDMDFFYSMLTHDYPFFLGHKQNEIQSAFKIDEKKYQGMPLLKASHFDLFRVEKAFLGFAQLQSLTNPGMANAFISMTERPKVGDVIFARLMPVGHIPRSFAFSAVEPWDTVNPDYVDKILPVFRRQYEAFCAKYPDTTTRAFMKIAAYHFYELMQFFELIPLLEQKISHLPDTVFARTISWIFTDPAKMPKLTDIPGAELIKQADGKASNLATVPICEDKRVPQTLREAIVSKEHKTLEVTLFMKDAGDSFVESVLKPCFKKAKNIEKIHKLDENETYRALRHLSL